MHKAPVLIPGALCHMKNKTSTMAELRMAAGISLNDLAYLIKISTGNLQKIEDGLREPSVMVVLIYHMLFGAPLEDMLADLYAHLHAQLLEQSHKLIANLEKRQSPKSIHRIESLNKIVNSLEHTDYEFVN